MLHHSDDVGFALLRGGSENRGSRDCLNVIARSRTFAYGARIIRISRSLLAFAQDESPGPAGSTYHPPQLVPIQNRSSARTSGTGIARAARDRH
jgi:hypothetical protein